MGSDLLISLNIPVEIGLGSAADEVCHAAVATPEAGLLLHPLIESILSTLRINDWALFG